LQGKAQHCGKETQLGSKQINPLCWKYRSYEI